MLMDYVAESVELVVQNRCFGSDLVAGIGENGKGYISGAFVLLVLCVT